MRQPVEGCGESLRRQCDGVGHMNQCRYERNTILIAHTVDVEIFGATGPVAAAAARVRVRL